MRLLLLAVCLALVGFVAGCENKMTTAAGSSNIIGTPGATTAAPK